MAVVAVCLALGLALAFQCNPVRASWLNWDGEHPGKCLNTHIIVLTGSGCNISLDLLVIGLPVRQIAQLKMTWRDKIPLMAVFTLGFLQVQRPFSKTLFLTEN